MSDPMRRRLVTALIGLVAPIAVPAAAQVRRAPPATSAAAIDVLQVRGDAGQTAALTLAELAALPRETVKAPSGHGGASRSYEGARLVDVLRSVGAPLGARLHGPPVTDVVVFVGTDGYRAVMALADADPDSHPPARIIVADKAEGQPLDAKEGPLRLVIEGDLRAIRSVHNLARVEIRRLP